MEPQNASPSSSLWQLFISSVPKAPWKGFFYGLFLPLILMQVSDLLHKQMLGVELALALCIVFFVVDTLRMKQLCIFPLITLFMIVTQCGSGILSARHPEWASTLIYVPMFDNGVIALAFLITVITRKPLIMVMLDPESLKSIPEKIRNSSYYLNAWRLVTLLWGVLYVVQPVVLLILHFHHLPGGPVLEYLFGWPFVAIFLVVSVMLPRWYWRKNMLFIEQEAQKVSVAS